MRQGPDLIEFQDGTIVEMHMGAGPVGEEQYLRARVVNEKMGYDHALRREMQWVKVEFVYEAEMSKFWIPRWKVQPAVLPTTLAPQRQ